MIIILRWSIIFVTLIIGISNTLFRWRKNNNHDHDHDHHRNIMIRFILFHICISLLLFLLLLGFYFSWLYYNNANNKYNESASLNGIIVSSASLLSLGQLSLFIIPIILWRPMKEILVEIIIRYIPSSNHNGGPLGIGYGKMMEVISAYILSTIIIIYSHNNMNYTLNHHLAVKSSLSSIHTINIGINNNIIDSSNNSITWFNIIMIMIVLSVVVNVVLWIWSQYYFTPVIVMKQQQEISMTRNNNNNNQMTTTYHINNSGDNLHEEERYVNNKSSIISSSKTNEEIIITQTNHSTLTSLISQSNNNNNNNTNIGMITTILRNHIILLLWALINASCEEYTSRYFWRKQFMILLTQLNDHSKTQNETYNPLLQSNILQAIIFGCWHYYGIPNGIIGVILTFIYGMMMGYISDYSRTHMNAYHPLVYPILLHTIADYFIFAYIVHQKPSSLASKKKTS